MRKILFSIIIPVYNAENYLLSCLKSILVQKNADYEVILIDDGSTDNSGYICDSFTSHRNVHILHQQNAGLSSTRNKGITIAQGDYILFVDADDMIDSDTLLSDLETNIRATNADVIAFGFKKTAEDGAVLRLHEFSCNTGELKYNFTDFFTRGLFTFSAWGKAIRRELFKRHNLAFVPRVTSEDMDWCVRLALAARIFSAVPGSQYVYVQHTQSLSRTRSEQRLLDVENNIITSQKHIACTTGDLRMALNAFISQFMSMYLIILSDFDTEIRRQHINSFARNHLHLLTYGKRFREKALCFCIHLGSIRLTLLLINIIKQILRKR